MLIKRKNAKLHFLVVFNLPVIKSDHVHVVSSKSVF